MTKIIRQPMHGDEQKFINFLETIKANKNEFNVEKLKEPRFITGMINLIQQGKTTCLFAEKDFEIVGFANVIKQGNTALVGIAVSKTERGTGTSKELLENTEIESSKIGIRTLKADVNRENEASINFFIKNGYKKTNEEKNRVFLKKKLQ